MLKLPLRPSVHCLQLAEVPLALSWESFRLEPRIGTAYDDRTKFFRRILPCLLETGFHLLTSSFVPDFDVLRKWSRIAHPRYQYE